MKPFVVPYLPYDRLRKTASEFLDKYHPTRTIPIPIEEIIEFKMGIDIIPMPSIQSTLQIEGLDVLGFTSSDLKEITVDEWIWKNRIGRYRFTLAHEVGHVTLHKIIYQNIPFKSIQEWKEFINNIPDNVHSLYEWQAYAFAGLVLVPETPLKTAINKHMKIAQAGLKKEGIRPLYTSDFVWNHVYKATAKDFEVSPEVVHKRVDYDRLKKD